MPQLRSQAINKTVRSLTGDPDGCPVGFWPLGALAPFALKAKPGSIIIRSSKGFRLGLDFPGTADQWSLVTDPENRRLRFVRADIGMALRLRTRSGAQIEMELAFSVRPPADSIRLVYALPVGASLRVNPFGALEVVDSAGLVRLALQPWRGRDADGKRVRIAWRMDGSLRLWVDLNSADLDVAVYPVEAV